jgi:acyl transferase domain-containing protein
MEAVVPEFKKVVETAVLHPPRIPIISTVTGALLTDAQAVDPDYWARHLRQTVMFCPAMRFLWKDAPERIVIEIGPRTTLSTLGKQIASDQKIQVSVASLDIGAKIEAGPDADEEAAFLNAVGRIWSLGGNVDFEKFFNGERRKRILLPTYPFQRKRHWVDPPIGPHASSPATDDSRKSIENGERPKDAACTNAGQTDEIADVFARQLALMEAQLDALESSDKNW